MSDTCASKEPASEELVDGHLSTGGARRPSSIVSLSLVSGLNIACLAFIAYHFAGHAEDPKVVPAEDSAARHASDLKIPRLDPAPTGVTTDVSGNVELVPAAGNVISIMSSFPRLDQEPVEPRENPSTTITIAEEPIEAADAEAEVPLDHWVQLGALSRETTAQRYWSTLKLRHEVLLQDREPHYFGPAEVNGSLYHIRLGPMTADAAAGLCESLKAEGADCFCVGPDGGEA